MELTPKHIVLGIDGSKWIYTERRKTTKSVRIPLLPKAEVIINKYKNDPRSVYAGTLFPTISNQRLNSYLKELASLASIESKLTFHVARHTFATTVALMNGLPIETLSKILGHSKITTTFHIMLTSSFSMGQVVATSSIQSLMLSDLSFHTFVYTSLIRHEEGDWGEVDAEDHESNEMALVTGQRLFSVYHCSDEHSLQADRIYIITEADRSATTVLWPREY